MLILFILLWTLSAVFFLSDRKDTSIRWAGYTTFVGGTGGLFVTIDQIVIPYFQSGIMVEILQYISSFLSFIAHHGLPYTYLIFSLTCIKHGNPGRLRVYKIVFFIPLVIMLWITPLFPIIDVQYTQLSFWVVPYIITGNLLLFRVYWKEENPFLKRRKFITMLLAIPTMTWMMFTNYLLLIFNIVVWHYNVIAIIIMCAIFVYSAIKYDALGIKLFVKKISISNSIRTMSYGTSILNHAIKNQLSTISLTADLLELRNEQDMTTIAILKQSVSHLNNIMERVRSQMQDIVITTVQTNMNELINSVLRGIQYSLQDKNIRVEVNMKALLFVCDPVHLKEVLTNLLLNAIEASTPHSNIEIHAYCSKQLLTIMVKDYGAGIDKEHIQNIFDPFFSSKITESNMGLGLSYCYNVVNKCGGTIEVRSEVNKGTTIYVNLPAPN